jgi:hypothetical protein
MRKQPIQPRRAKLPPLLEIEEDGVNDMESWMSRPRWSADEDTPGGVALGEWPTEFDD